MTDEKREEQETLSDTISKVIEEAKKKAGREDDDYGQSQDDTEEHDQGTVGDGDADSEEETESEGADESQDEDDSEEQEDGGESDEGEGSDEEDDEDDLFEDEVEPPSSWSDGAKEEFKELPPRQQENIVKMMKGMQADYTQKVQGIAGVVTALKPIEQECLEAGVTYEEAIRRMVGTHITLLNDKPKGIRAIMQMYGVTPQEVLGIKSKEEEGIPESVRSELADLRKQVTQNRDMTEAELRAKNKQMVDDFKARPDVKYFDEVEQTMGDMAERASAAGQPIPDLQTLYDQACWVTPSVREKILAEERDSEARQKIKKRQKRVDRSKKASKVSKRSAAPSRREDDSAEQSLHSIIDRAYDAAAERAAKGK